MGHTWQHEGAAFVREGPQQGRKVFTRQTRTLPSCNEPFDDGVGKVAGFAPRAGVATRADERKKLERLCRYIARPAVSEKRLSHVAVSYDLQERAIRLNISSPMRRLLFFLSLMREHLASYTLGTALLAATLWMTFAGCHTLRY